MSDYIIYATAKFYWHTPSHKMSQLHVAVKGGIGAFTGINFYYFWGKPPPSNNKVVQLFLAPSVAILLNKVERNFHLSRIPSSIPSSSQNFATPSLVLDPGIK